MGRCRIDMELIAVAGPWYPVATPDETIVHWTRPVEEETVSYKIGAATSSLSSHSRRAFTWRTT